MDPLREAIKEWLELVPCAFEDDPDCDCPMCHAARKVQKALKHDHPSK